MHVINNLVLTCKNEISNTTETLLINILDKIVIYEKDNCLNHSISRVILLLFLLVVISIVTNMIQNIGSLQHW